MGKATRVASRLSSSPSTCHLVSCRYIEAIASKFSLTSVRSTTHTTMLSPDSWWAEMWNVGDWQQQFLTTPTSATAKCELHVLGLSGKWKGMRHACVEGLSLPDTGEFCSIDWGYISDPDYITSCFMVKQQFGICVNRDLVVNWISSLDERKCRRHISSSLKGEPGYCDNLGRVHTTLFRTGHDRSRPVARVHTGAIGTLVPRDHLSTWNEWAWSIAIGCAQSSLSCGRSSGRYRPVSNSAAVSARLLDLLLPLKAHVRFHTSSIDQSNMTLWSKADTRTLISIWGDANIQDGLDNCRRNGEVYK